MYNLNNRQTAKAKKLLSLAILCGLGLSVLSPSAEARLIFTTEEDGVDADAYTLDQDGTVAVSENTDLDLNFGANLGASISYNDSTGQFTFNKDVNLGGNVLEDFKIESFTTAGAPTCTLAGEAGRMYYDTTANEMMVCTGVGGWDSVEDTAGTGSITTTEILDGTILNEDIANDAIQGGVGGVIQDGSITADDLGTDSVDSDEIAADAVTASEIATGAVTTDEILDGTILNGDIANDAIQGGVGGVIQDGSITADDLGTDSVNSDEIAADAVTASEIATGAVTTDEILDGTILNGDIANDAIQGGVGGVIQDGSITADDLGTDSVDSDEIAANAVGDSEIDYSEVTLADFANDLALTSAQIFVGNASGIATGVTMSGDATISNTGVFTLADGSVSGGLGGVITDGSITADDLGTDSVDSDEIAADAVTASEIATGAVTTDEILDGTILNGDIANDAIQGGVGGVIQDGSITADDLGTDSVDSDEIAADAVTASEIATGAVTTDEILDGTILNGDIANDAIQGGVGGVIQDGSITADDLGTDSVDSDEIAADAVTASEIATGAVTTDEILDGTILNGDIANDAIQGGVGGVIQDGSITADDLGTDSVNSDEIAADAVTASEIATGAVTTDEILDGTVSRTDLAEVAVSLIEAPEFASFTIEADGTNNKGTFEADHDSTANKNYYAWSTRKTAALHDYDLVYQWQVPENFVSFQATPIEIDYKTDTTASTDNKIDIVEILDTAGTSVGAITGGADLVSSTADTWVEDADVTFSTAGTFTAGEYITIRFRFSSEATTKNDRNPAYLGPIKFNLNVK